MGDTPDGQKIIGAVILYGAAIGGVGLISVGLAGDETEMVMVVIGALLLLVSIPLIIVRTRMGSLSPEERQARLGAMTERLEAAQEPGARLRSGHKEAKRKKPILAKGVDGTAIIQSLTFGGRANTYHSLVLMELEVHVPGGEPYEVDTGEYVTAAGQGSLAPGNELVVKVDPDDPQKVAVDWDASLRLR
jgi:hypothetical protein